MRIVAKAEHGRHVQVIIPRKGVGREVEGDAVGGSPRPTSDCHSARWRDACTRPRA